MITNSTLDFLNKLKKNNSKDWLDTNRQLYLDAKKNVTDLVAELIAQITVFDKGVKGLEPAKCMFRINRDIRFSKDKSPYKTNFGASITEGGKKSMVPGYYLHIEPGNSFLAGGSYMPPAPQLAAIRQEIDYNTQEFKKIISAKTFTSNFGKLDSSDKLKTAPKGYPKDHPELDLLKYKSYIVVHPLSNEQVLNKNFAKHCASVFKAMQPLNSFLKRAMD